ncbi:hypothetical protein G6F65_021305 [Rhizopus arrhizus]|nr:hypothetical protein G6F65_021305 [Rhizopus arrhizus]
MYAVFSGALPETPVEAWTGPKITGLVLPLVRFTKNRLQLRRHPLSTLVRMVAPTHWRRRLLHAALAVGLSCRWLPRSATPR